MRAKVVEPQTDRDKVCEPADTAGCFKSDVWKWNFPDSTNEKGEKVTIRQTENNVQTLSVLCRGPAVRITTQCKNVFQVGCLR